MAPSPPLLFGWEWSPGGPKIPLLYLISLLSQTGVLTLLYTLMPVDRLSLRYALVGGIAAALLREKVATSCCGISPSRHWSTWFMDR